VGSIVFYESDEVNVDLSWLPEEVMKAISHVEAINAKFSDEELEWEHMAQQMAFSLNDSTITSHMLRNASKPQVFLADSPAGECDICGSGTVAGPGGAVCNVSDVCTTPHVNPSENGSIYTPHHILLGQLSVMVGEESDGKKNITSSAIRQALRYVLTDGTQTHRGIQVTVWDGRLPAALQEYSSDASNDPSAFFLGFVATSEEDAKTIIGGFNHSAGGDGNGGGGGDFPLYSSLLKAVQSADGSISDVKVSCCGELFVPSYSSKAFHQEAVQGLTSLLGKRSIIVSEKGYSTVPVLTIAPSTTYTIHLTGFAPHTNIDLTMVATSSSTLLPTNTAIDTVKTDATGAVDFEWEIAPTQPTGRCYVSAMGRNGVFATSSVLQVVQTRRRRKLGPLVEIPY